MSSDRTQNLSESYIPIENNLPEGWIEITLNQILQALESGSRPKGGVRGIAEGIPSIGGEHINEGGGFRFETIKFVPHNFFKQMNHGHIQTGDILIVKDGATTGKVALVRDDFPYNPAAVNEHVFICRPEEGIHPPFLFYFLFSKEGQDRILENFRGSAQGGINHSFAPGTTVPLAPLVEQKRVVAKLEELLARVNVTKERLAKVSMILKRFRQSVLAAACSGRLTADWRETYLDFERPEELIQRIYRERLTYYEEVCRTPRQTGQKCPRKPPNLKPQIRQSEIEIDLPASWFWTSLEDIASVRQHSTSSGPFGSALGNKDYRHSGVPVIRGQNIRNGVFLLRNYVYVSEKKASELVRSIAYPGDIVVVAVGSSGQAAIVPKDLPKAVLSQNCNKITIDESIALPEFVILFLQIEIAQNQLREKTTDTARPFLSLTNLKKTLVALPQVEEQKEIVCRVEEMFKLADAVDKQVMAATARTEKLTQAILAKAFRGELVPTEAELARRESRAYEPASELLTRIKSDRESKQASQKVRRNRG
jgi:type I restriction enzyme S subunit